MFASNLSVVAATTCSHVSLRGGYWFLQVSPVLYTIDFNQSCIRTTDSRRATDLSGNRGAYALARKARWPLPRRRLHRMQRLSFRRRYYPPSCAPTTSCSTVALLTRDGMRHEDRRASLLSAGGPLPQAAACHFGIRLQLHNHRDAQPPPLHQQALSLRRVSGIRCSTKSLRNSPLALGPLLWSSRFGAYLGPGAAPAALLAASITAGPPTPSPRSPSAAAPRSLAAHGISATLLSSRGAAVAWFAGGHRRRAIVKFASSEARPRPSHLPLSAQRPRPRLSSKH